ncbi:MAG: hypothetical protein JSW11_03305 [Candidatus Heimdallarchaeota archaeon]|nr:MAG: hypothetical protein JSW11_03305 [Candidatus Heimdallarchaeota archaeon]
MSYVEKAFWDYLKTTLFGGVRILFSKRLILFSLILFVTSVMTTGAVVLQSQTSETISIGEFTLLELTFMMQISIALGFIISGLVSKKLNTLIRFILLLIVVVITLVVLLIENISDLIFQYFPLVAFLSWAFLVPLASFAFSKGMFDNKITGSVLFLGKPTTDHKSIFSGVMTLVAIASLLWNIVMAYIGFTENRLSYLVLGIIGIVVAFLIILVVQGWIFNDDIFNTTLGFFFVMTLPNQIMIFLTSVTGSESIITSFDYFFVIFSLLYSAQNISRRVKMKGVVIDPSEKSKKKVREDPFRIGRFIGFVGGEGVVLIYLGLALGFHLIQLQIMSGVALVWEDIFGTLSFSEGYHDITMVFMVIILILVCIVYTLQRGKGYWAAEIYRFDFLPPYEDLVDYMERIKRGEISKTDIALTVGKKAVEASGVGVFSAARKFRDKIFGEKNKSDQS